MIRSATIMTTISRSPHLHSLWRKLSVSEKTELLDIVREYDHLDAGPYESAIDRHYLEKPKPRRWTTIVELAVALK